MRPPCCYGARASNVGIGTAPATGKPWMLIASACFLAGVMLGNTPKSPTGSCLPVAPGLRWDLRAVGTPRWDRPQREKRFRAHPARYRRPLTRGCHWCRHDGFPDRMHITAPRKAFWGFTLRTAGYARVGPLPLQLVHVKLHALNFALHPNRLLLEHRYLLGGGLLQQLRMIHVRDVETIEKVVVLSGLQSDMAPIRATLVLGEITNISSQTCHCSSSFIGQQCLCFGSRPPDVIVMEIVHIYSFVLQYPRRIHSLSTLSRQQYRSFIRRLGAANRHGLAACWRFHIATFSFPRPKLWQATGLESPREFSAWLSTFASRFPTLQTWPRLIWPPVRETRA